MKKKLLWILLAFTTTIHAAAPELSQPSLLAPLQQEAKAANLTAQFLTRYHYKKVPIDDVISEKVFDRYLKSLDPEKVFLIQADIDRFNGGHPPLVDAIYGKNLSVPFALFNLYEQRVIERLTYARELLKQDFDFTKQESYQYSREKEPWPKSDAEVRDLWRKRVKNEWLRLKLAGKEDKAIRDTLDKRYANMLARIYKYKSEDVFQVFMNAYTMSIDPHTNYLGPKASEDFDISMRLSLEGIGAVLQEKDEYVTIRELVPGGPALLSGNLGVGDRIVGVAQAANDTPTDIVGWRIDDAVRLIRGPKDSLVVLDILPAGAGLDGKHKLVTLTRNKITLEEQAAKKSVMPIKMGSTTRRIGVITLSSFYQDTEARRKGDINFKSAARDVSRLLGELKKEGVDGVLMDLRNNGGGSLDEAVQLTGLFIDKGPVVQAKDSQGNVKIENDTNAGVAWDGPLGVLINRASASASEIFAAAIQDYGRGVIIGEPSFGKGTVQTLISLDQVARQNKPELGELKMTIAQFFRINGGTTQLRGVTPDISFPTLLDAEAFGENSYDNALPWTQIKAADYTPVSDVKSLLPSLETRHQGRISKDKDFQYLQEDIALLKAQRKKNSVSLNEAERRKEKDVQEAKQLARAETNNSGSVSRDKKNTKDAGIIPISENVVLKDDGLQSNERNLNVELAEEKAQKNAKDILLNEALRILSDEVDLLKTKPKMSAQK